MDYCKKTDDEILQKSVLLKKIEERKFSNYTDREVSFSTNTEGLIGTNGNCGNFAIALNHHLCNKGTLLMSAIDQKSLLGDVTHPIHAVLRFKDCIFDFRGKLCKKEQESEEDFQKRAGLNSFGNYLIEMAEESIPIILLNTNKKRIERIEKIFRDEDNE